MSLSAEQRMKVGAADVLLVNDDMVAHDPKPNLVCNARERRRNISVLEAGDNVCTSKRAPALCI
jgi:hypothetical protein